MIVPRTPSASRFLSIKPHANLPKCAALIGILVGGGPRCASFFTVRSAAASLLVATTCTYQPFPVGGAMPADFAAGCGF